MTVPMIVLAIGSVFAGVLLFSALGLPDWLAPSLGELQELEGGALPHDGGPVARPALLGAGRADRLPGGRPPAARPVERPEPVSLPVRAARRDLYANAINETLIARPGTWLSRVLVYVDNRGVDGVVNGTAALLGGSSGRLRRTADRVRPLLRAVDARRRGARRRGAAGGEVRMTDLNGGNVLLLVLLLLPLVGALVVAPLTANARRPSSSRWASRSCRWCSRPSRGSPTRWPTPSAARGSSSSSRWTGSRRSAPASRSASTASRW